MSSKRQNPSSFALALETSGRQGSVAIGRGDDMLASQPFSGPRQHAVEFFPCVDRLCRDQGIRAGDIEHIYLSIGPGSFTGLRIGAAAARMISFATGASLVPVPTLEVIAQNALNADPPPDHVVVLLDAKRHHTYAALFCRTPEGYVSQTEPAEHDPAEFLAQQPPQCAILGEGIAYHRDSVNESGRLVLPEDLWLPQVETVFQIGRKRAKQGISVDRKSLIPIYIRPPEAEEKWAATRANGHKS